MDRVIGLPADADHVVISSNPIAGAGGRRSRIDGLRGCLRELGYPVEHHTEPTAAAARAMDLHAAGRLRTLVAAGGDGTVAELVNRTPPGLPITVLPLGTENLLARYCQLGPDPADVAAAIDGGWMIQLDAAAANGRLFTLMVSCGFDAEVVDRLHARRRGHIHRWHYARPILHAIRSYQYPELRVYCDGAPPISARWAFLFNLPCYAAGLRIAPQAVGTDGQLDLVTFRRGSLPHGLRYLWGIVRGRHQRLADCLAQRVARLRIESTESVAYQLDGDAGGRLPVEIAVMPRRMSVVLSRQRAQQIECASPSSVVQNS